MNKGTINISVTNMSHSKFIKEIRESYKKYSDYKVNIVVSGKQDMKDNIVKFAKARVDT